MAAFEGLPGQIHDLVLHIAIVADMDVSAFITTGPTRRARRTRDSSTVTEPMTMPRG